MSHLATPDLSPETTVIQRDSKCQGSKTSGTKTSTMEIHAAQPKKDDGELTEMCTKYFSTDLLQITDRATLKFDGVFRSSPRGWFTFGHASFALLFFFKHIWHGARTLFMMAPLGASGSGSGEGAGGRGFSLTDLFGSSSPGNSEAGLIESFFALPFCSY
ncbi:hypothetical protein HAX54_043174, partial [Datura stramonium]|nr:hypothetical protein [Datura stramonium]